MSSRTYPYECGHKLPMVRFYVRLLRRGPNTFHAFCAGCVPQGGHRLGVPGSNWQEITQAEWSYKELGLAPDVKPLYAHEPLKVAAKAPEPAVPPQTPQTPKPRCPDCVNGSCTHYIWVDVRLSSANQNCDVFPEGPLDIGSMKPLFIGKPTP